MAVEFRSLTATGWNGASGSVTKPSGTAENDALLTIAMTDGANSITPPSGWVLEEGPIDSGTNYRGWLYSLVAGASEPASYGWAGTDAEWAFITSAYSGCDPAAAVNQTSGVLTADDNPVAPNAIVPSVDNCMIVALFGIRADGLFPATPDSSPAATERSEHTWADGTPDLLLYQEDFLQATAASVQLQATFASTGPWVAFGVALKPSSGAPAAAPKLRTVQSNLRW
jgi:hypothetical protein